MQHRPDDSFKKGHKPNPFIVGQTTKAVFNWSAFLLLGVLLVFTVSKRVTYRKLMVNHIMEPTPMGNPTAPPIAPKNQTTKMPFDLSAYRASGCSSISGPRGARPAGMKCLRWKC